MTNHQCYCYGIMALNNIIKAKMPLTSETFYNELFYLWDVYTEYDIQEKYFNTREVGKLEL